MPPVWICTSSIDETGMLTYPHQGLTAEVISAPSTMVEYDTIPAPRM